MNENFLECWINRRHTVLGYKLEPYSLAHCLALSAIQSPVTTGSPLNASDIILALKVCSSPDPLNADLRFSLRDQWAVWRLRTRDAVLVATGELIQYIYDYSAPPEFWENKSGDASRRITAPTLLSRIAFLLTYSHLTLDEILFLPLGQAIWLHAAIAELRGAELSFLTDEDAAAMEQARKAVKHGGN